MHGHHLSPTRQRFPDVGSGANPSHTIQLSRSWRPSLVNALRALWVLVIFYQESYIWKSHIAECDWPRWHKASPAAIATRDAAGARVVLIGDPQLVDENTYARRGLALVATQFYTDLYMRRNYRLLYKRLQPQQVIFTGDLFDGGREWADDAVWEAEYARFQTIFPSLPGTNVSFNLPGNHDIGITDGMRPAVHERFSRHFGNTSVAFDLGGWQVVLLDSIALTSSESALSEPALAFMAKLGPPTKPRLLVTHVPLYRPPESDCGPLRESKQGLLIQAGHQYQNVLLPETSDAIWKQVQPTVIFAGDDHDYCDHIHTRPFGLVHEINVKSFSWAMGIQQPGFQLVSLSGDSYETHLCLLPGQLPLLINYAALLVLTLILLAAAPFYKGPREMRGWSYLPLTTFEADPVRQGVNLEREGAKAKLAQAPATLSGKAKLAAGQFMSVAWVVLGWYGFVIWW